MIESEFSVLMSIYSKENPQYFNRCMQSIWFEQTLRPNQIVLVRDGPLTLDLNKALNNWQIRLGSVLLQVHLRENGGLGAALNIGIHKCSHELIARMDSDDISLPTRFEKQLFFLNNNLDVDVVGSAISEFEGCEKNVYAYRTLPLSPEELCVFAKSRSPLNHGSVMFRKSKIIAAGNYGNHFYSQDYFLWAGLLKNGSRLANLPETLVNVRAGRDMIRRRGGIKYALIEYTIQKQFLANGFISLKQFFVNIFIRVPVRLLPQAFRVVVYKLLRSRNGE